MRLGIEKELEQLDKDQLETILLKLIYTNKVINVGNKVRNEVNKAHQKEITGLQNALRITRLCYVQ